MNQYINVLLHPHIHPSIHEGRSLDLASCLSVGVHCDPCNPALAVVLLIGQSFSQYVGGWRISSEAEWSGAPHQCSGLTC